MSISATSARYGVLFLDEIPELGNRGLEVMRQCVEDKVATIRRAQGTLPPPTSP